LRDLNNVQWRTRCFYHQALDDSDADRTKPCFITEAKADMEGPFSDHGPVCDQGHLGYVRNRTVPSQLTNASAVDLLNGGQACADRSSPENFLTAANWIVPAAAFSS